MLYNCFGFAVLDDCSLELKLVNSDIEQIDSQKLLRYTLGDKLQQHVAATRCSDRSLRVYWRIFVKIFVAATEFCRRNKSHKFSLT